MNYLNHYNALINRAKNRKLDIYTESHHIIPRCINGADDKSNLVDLTPEEHYTAHLLLVRIYPGNRELIHAATMMTVEGKNHNRSKNKLYGWLRRRLSIVVSESQQGIGNSQYGTRWINNGIKEIKIPKNSNIPDGYLAGRIRLKKICCLCDSETPSYKSLYCLEHRKEIYSLNGKKKTTHFDTDSAKKIYKNRIFITNGIEDRTIDKDLPIPDNWIKGRTQNKHKSAINSAVE